AKRTGRARFSARLRTSAAPARAFALVAGREPLRGHRRSHSDPEHKLEERREGPDIPESGHRFAARAHPATLSGGSGSAHPLLRIFQPESGAAAGLSALV